MRCLIVAIALMSQAPEVRREFDVVSVKPSAPDEHNSFMYRSLPGGVVRMVGVPVMMILMQVYEVKAFQILGGPDWVRTDRWDILAKAEGVQGRLPNAQEYAMTRAMLEDRFQLRTHNETREMPVYALVVQKNGSKLAISTVAERQFRTGNGSLIVKKQGMDRLATWLSRELGRVVIDRTDLRDEYDYSLEWSPDPGQGGAESYGLPPEAPRPHPETNGPSIFTALQEQLGLRLVSAKGPVEVVVIDSVERPSAN